MEEILKQLAEINTKLNKLDILEDKLEQNLKINEKLQAENQQLKKALQQQEERIDSLEREMMKKDIIIYGIEEENEEESEPKIITKINKIINPLGIVLNIDQDVQEIRRIGRKLSGKERPVYIKLTTERTRNKILKEKKNLKHAENKIWIEEAFSRKVLEQRKELVKIMKVKRQQGSKATVKYNKLIIDGQIYTTEELKGTETHPQTPEIPSTSKNKARTFSQRTPDEADKTQDVTFKGKIQKTKITTKN